MSRLHLLSCALLLTLVPVSVAMHLRLVKSAPNDREVVNTPTKEIRLWFSQKPEVHLTSISVVRTDSSTVAIGKTVATDDSLSVKAALNAPLPPGDYLVRWRALSKDGHAVRGTYSFQQNR